MKKDLTIKTTDQLTTLLRLVAEATSGNDVADSERLAQEKTSAELSDYRAPPESAKEEKLDDEEVEEAEGESPDAVKSSADNKSTTKPAKDLTKLGSADPTPDKPRVPSPQEVMGADLGSVIKNLNKIRSGKSLKDEMTKRELNDYLKGLSTGERQSLFVFLDGLSQIMAGGVPGEKAPDPGAVGITINATTKIKEPKQSSMREPVQLAKEKSPTGSPSVGEPKPIVVGEVADKAEIRRLVHQLMID